jgi:hypothetical protein
MENLIQKSGEPIVEGGSKVAICEHLGQVILGEEPGPNRSTDRGSETWLVLWDRTLEEADPPSTDFRRFVGVEQHPNRDGVGEAPGYGAKCDRHQASQQLF